MSKHRYNVGLLMTASDADVAAYLNFLFSNKQTPAKWLSAMLVANEQNIPFPIPDFSGSTFTPAAPAPNKPSSISAAPQLIFGTGSTIRQDTPDKWGYGWQVRGKQGEAIKGSVINVSFCRPEIVQMLYGMRNDGYKIASFIKELIKNNMTVGGDYVTEAQASSLLRFHYLKPRPHSDIPEHPLPSPAPKQTKSVSRTETVVQAPEKEASPLPQQEEDNPLLAFI